MQLIIMLTEDYPSMSSVQSAMGRVDLSQSI